MMARVALALALVIAAATIVPRATALSGEASAPSSIANQALGIELAGYVAELDGSYGIAAISLEDGSSAFVNGDVVFPTASMYKVLVMYRVFQAIEAGELSPADRLEVLDADMIDEEPDGGFWPGETPTVAQALHGMITASSNSASSALTRAVGGWGVVASASEELGMYSTYIADGEFWSSPSDMAAFFRLLAARSLVSEWASEEMIDLLLAQQSNDRIPALLPEGVQVAHKTGELPGVRNDGGIVRGPGGRYVLVMMSRWADPGEAVGAEAELSRIVYDWYGT